MVFTQCSCSHLSVQTDRQTSFMCPYWFLSPEPTLQKSGFLKHSRPLYKRAVHTRKIRILVASKMLMQSLKSHPVQYSAKLPDSRTLTKFYQSWRQLPNQFSSVKLHTLEHISRASFSSETQGNAVLTPLALK